MYLSPARLRPSKDLPSRLYCKSFRCSWNRSSTISIHQCSLWCASGKTPSNDESYRLRGSRSRKCTRLSWTEHGDVESQTTSPRYAEHWNWRALERTSLFRSCVTCMECLLPNTDTIIILTILLRRLSAHSLPKRIRHVDKLWHRPLTMPARIPSCNGQDGPH